MRAILIVGVLFVALGAFANPELRHAFTEEETKQMLESNWGTALLELAAPELQTLSERQGMELFEEGDVRAYAEYDEAGYLIFNSTYFYESETAKKTMAKNLPEGVKLVIFTGDSSAGAAKRIKDDFKGFISPSRLSVVYMPGGSNGFWARDGVPVPVYRTVNGVEKFTVVDARYSRFEQDKRFKDLFNADMTRHNYFYEGGNFMANSINECLVVNTQATNMIPNHVFEIHYGCKTLIRLPHVKGIGHVDEVVKFIDDSTVVTDEKSYVEVLEKQGYKVILLPEPFRQYETYINSLIVNGTVFVPIFKESGDKAALKAYEDAGFEKVIGLDSRVLSTQGLGSIHCITMTYPPVEMNKLLKAMGGSILE